MTPVYTLSLTLAVIRQRSRCDIHFTYLMLVCYLCKIRAKPWLAINKDHPVSCPLTSHLVCGATVRTARDSQRRQYTEQDKQSLDQWRNISGLFAANGRGKHPTVCQTEATLHWTRAHPHTHTHCTIHKTPSVHVTYQYPKTSTHLIYASDRSENHPSPTSTHTHTHTHARARVSG